MKKVSIALLLLFSLNSYSQSLKFNAGTAMSKLNWKPTGGFDKMLISFTGGVGITYLNRKSVDLTTSINYLQKGGKDEVQFTDNSGSFLRNETVKAQFNYVNLSQSIRLKYPSKKIMPYINAGFYVGYLTSTSDLINKDVMNDINFGGIAGLGIVKKIKKNEIGLEINYLPSFNKIRDTSDDQYHSEIKDNTFSVTLVFGLHL